MSFSFSFSFEPGTEAAVTCDNKLIKIRCLLGIFHDTCANLGIHLTKREFMNEEKSHRYSMMPLVSCYCLPAARVLLGSDTLRRGGHAGAHC